MEDGKIMINIIYEDNHLLVVEKPINIPVQEDSSRDMDLLTMLKQYLKEKYNKPGNVYLGLIHRLDRPVGGIMVFAKTSKAASRLSEQIRNNSFEKVYYAIVEGKALSNDKLEDFLLKDQKNNIVTVDRKGKKAILHYQLLEYIYPYSLVKINLETGRSHQIRVQFSSRNLPLYGDQKYNKNAKVGEQIALFAKEIKFMHPVTKEELHFTLDLPKFKPWTIFSKFM